MNITGHMASARFIKSYRVYFDRRDEHGKVWWSVDEGTPVSEIKVGWFSIQGADVRSETCLEGATDEGEQSGWIEFEACAFFADGGARFYGKDWK